MRAGSVRASGRTYDHLLASEDLEAVDHVVLTNLYRIVPALLIFSVIEQLLVVQSGWVCTGRQLQEIWSVVECWDRVDEYLGVGRARERTTLSTHSVSKKEYWSYGSALYVKGIHHTM